MRPRLMRTAGSVWAFTVWILVCGLTPAIAGDLKGEAILVWGTDASSPPEGKAYKPVEPELLKKLKELPLKWSHWFEVSRKNFAVPLTGATQVAMSEKCQIDVKVLGPTEVEVVLIGKGKEVVRRKQALPKGETLFLGGNAPNSTAWLVVLKRIE